MIDYVKPHTAEWFAAMDRMDPRQATQTREALGQSGHNDGCSICGDGPAADCRMTDPQPAPGAVGTLRLCEDCHTILIITRSEVYTPI